MKRIVLVTSVIIFLVILLFLAIAISPANIKHRIPEFAIVTQAEINGSSESPGLMDLFFVPTDLNNDTYPDLIVNSLYKNTSGGLCSACLGSSAGDGQVNIFYGNSDGFARTSVAYANVTINGTESSQSQLGISVAVGDMNNDGRMDLVIGANMKNLSGGASDAVGQAYIFYGAADGSGFNRAMTSAMANVTLNGSSPSSFGFSVAISDFNNDSITDLAVGAPVKNLSYGAYDYTGQVYIFYRSSSGTFLPYTADNANVTLNGTSPSAFGGKLFVYDFNKDNYTDLAVSAYRKNLSYGAYDNTGQVNIFYRGSDAIFHPYNADQANITINGTRGEYSISYGYGYFGSRLAVADFNNDSNMDLALSSYRRTLFGVEDVGQVHVFYGSSDGLYSTTITFANATLNGSSASRFGVYMQNADMNRDGYMDLVVSADAKNLSYGAKDYTGQIHIFYGGPNGISSSLSDQANVTINGTSSGYFGATFQLADANYDNVTDIIAVAEGINLGGGERDYTGKVYIFILNFPPTSSTISNQSWNEDTSITLNLSQYFTDVNRDNPNYTWTSPLDITVSIEEATNVATLTPNANWHGTEYIMFYANDSYNDLVASNNITLTVSNTADCGDNTCDPSESCTSCALDCGSCPAVSGSSTSPTEPKAAHTFTTVTPEKPAIADFKNMAVSSITLTTDETATNVKVEVKEVSQTDIPMPETGVYKLIDIKASNIELKEAKIKFKVKLSWLKENDVGQGEVVLMHHKDSWETLRTIYTGKDDENAYYEAKTGSLSMFAISYQKKEVEEEEPIQEEPEQEEKAETPIEPTLPVKEKHIFFPIISVIIALILIAVILKKRKH